MLRYRIRQSYRIVGMYRGIAFSFFMLIVMLFANHIVFDLKPRYIVYTFSCFAIIYRRATLDISLFI